MKTIVSFNYVFKIGLYFSLLIWTSFMAFAQCPNITQPSSPIDIASGLVFSDLDVIASASSDVIWYNSSTGGIVLNDNQLVYEGTFYAGDLSGTCGSRQPLIVDFAVPPSGSNLDKFFCSNDNPIFQDYITQILQPDIPVSGSVEIYSDFELTNIIQSTDAIPTGPADYYIIFKNSSGDQSQIEIGSVAVIASPTEPTPPTIQEFCSDQGPLTIGHLDPGTTATFRWYNNIDGFGNTLPPALTSGTALIDGNTYYVQLEGFCKSNPVPVTVTINSSFDAGSSANLGYCISEVATVPPFDLFDTLGGVKDTNGSWTGPLTTTNGYQGTVDVSTLTTEGIYTFTYTVPSNGSCPGDFSTVEITIFETLSSGSASLITNPAIYCEKDLPTSFDLFTLLDGSEDLGGQWTQGVIPVSSTFNLSVLVPGTTYDFTYTQNGLPNPCLEDFTTVQVIVLEDPKAGTASNLTFCENDLALNSPFDLFTALSGQDNNLGTWTDASNNIISNSIDITGFTEANSPYQFTYTISNGTCEDTETISFIIEPAPESGTPVAIFSEFCEGSAPTNYDLFDLLTDEDQSGTWYIGTDNTGSSTSNPVNLSALSVGTHNFTYDVDAIGSCDDSLVTVSITINPLPVTGTPLPTVFCENDLVANSPLDLYSRLTGEDAGGTWIDDDTSNALTGSSVDLTLLTTGFHNFTYSITDANGCSSSSTVTVQVEDAPESGTAIAPLELCLSEITVGKTIDLFDLLTGEDQTGTWNDDDASGNLSENILTVDGLAAGTYNFTYDVNAIGFCDDVNITVSVIINDVIAPAALAIQEFCDNATVADLETITGTTIRWYDESTGGTALVDTTPLLDTETYYATQTDITTGCESANRSLVTVSIYQTPNTGTPNTIAIVACNDDNSIDLFAGLDGTEDIGGVWQDIDGTGALIDNIFDATVNGVGTYQFAYFIAGSAPCVNASTVITVTVEESLNAGVNINPTLDICSNNGTMDLFSLLGGADSGGIWSPALASTTGVFDPLLDAQGTYTYTLSNACGNVSNTVEVDVTQAPNAGTDNTVSICVIDGTTDLFPFLGSAQSGGTWFPALDSGTGEFNPLVDVAGEYTYTVTALAPCNPESTAKITVIVNNTVPPTVVNPSPEYCLVNNPTVENLNATISATGTVIWYADAALTMPLTITEALVDGEDYYATQTNSTGCESSIAVQINVTVNDTVTPTLDDASIEYCINDGPTINTLSQNIIEFVSADNNIIWYDAVKDGSVISSSSILTSMTYYAALIDAATGCESSVRLEVTPIITACGLVELPDGFSPNGDGINDTYDYDNLGVLFPKFEIEIYNRYGSLVYRGKDQTPRFDGKSNQGRTLGSGDLPVGMYYYILKYNDGVNKPKQGNLYLSR